jgi:hypothetical protein
MSFYCCCSNFKYINLYNCLLLKTFSSKKQAKMFAIFLPWMLLPTNSWNNFTPQLREPGGEENSRKQVEGWRPTNKSSGWYAWRCVSNRKKNQDTVVPIFLVVVVPIFLLRIQKIKLATGTLFFKCKPPLFRIVGANFIMSNGL